MTMLKKSLVFAQRQNDRNNINKTECSSTNENCPHLHCKDKNCERSSVRGEKNYLETYTSHLATAKNTLATAQDQVWNAHKIYVAAIPEKREENYWKLCTKFRENRKKSGRAKKNERQNIILI